MASQVPPERQVKEAVAGDETVSSQTRHNREASVIVSLEEETIFPVLCVFSVTEEA